MPQSLTLVLDTSVLSEFAKPRPDQGVLNMLNEPRYQFAVPFGALVEVEAGIELRRINGHLRWKEHRRWLNLLMASDIEFLAANEHTARIYAKMVTNRHLKNFWYPHPHREPPNQPDQDLLIAASAITYGYPLVTRNVKHFTLIHSHYPLPGLLEPLFGWIVPPSERSPENEMRFLP